MVMKESLRVVSSAEVTKLHSKNLTPREGEVLSSLSTGSNKTIADRMGISEHTVRAHLRSFFAKTGVHSRGEAVVWGIKNGIVDMEKAVEGRDIELVNKLTDRNKEVFEELINNGFNYKKTQDRLQISLSTMRHHADRTRGILGGENIIQAGIIFMAAQERKKRK